ncbi:MAG: hypothetical protein MUC41_09125 [Syntrophobacteraceae bacterium]|jgi:hypothetical protein|nr:hypothetical protein [Syntrophobacteraceae bacterium]
MDSNVEPGRPDESAPGDETPSCFGDPATVCPKDESGFFQPRKECLDCSVVKECLQKALRIAGVLPTPILETPAAVRFKGFLKRWSAQKLSQGQTPPGASDG